MKERKMMSPWNDEAFTRLQAAIIVIAFVVVVALFMYFAMNANFFLP